MCTVLLRLDPAADWPLLLAAVRDEVTDRPWEPPGEYWPQEAPGLVGGRDRLAGGTWLAVRSGAPGGSGTGVPAGGVPGVAVSGAGVPGGARPAVAAVLNGSFMNRLEQSPPGSAPSSARPSRGRLPLRALTSGVPDAAELRAYEVVHLLVADADGARLVSWDGQEVTDVEIPPGDHIVTNEGLDVVDDPLVPHFAPLLDAARLPGEGSGPVAHRTPSAQLTHAEPPAGDTVTGPSSEDRSGTAGAAGTPGSRRSSSVGALGGLDVPGGTVPQVATAEWWGGWAELMRGDGLAEDDPRALLVRHELPDGRVFGSTSATLVALGREPGRARMDFTGTPSDPDWKRVEI
ncbi:hypothetical protein GCM10027059_01750 [Myceligenerans halotolerans]